MLLDVLHYISVAEQDEVLARVRCALQPGGVLLMRVGDAASRRAFLASQWVDRIVTVVRGRGAVPLFGRPLAQWIDRLRSLGFEVASEPMSRGMPFANVLLVANVPNGTGCEAPAAAPGCHKEGPNLSHGRSSYATRQVWS